MISVKEKALWEWCIEPSRPVFIIVSLTYTHSINWRNFDVNFDRFEGMTLRIVSGSCQGRMESRRVALVVLIYTSHTLFIYLCIYSFYLSIYSSIFPSISLFIYLFLFIYVSTYLIIHLSLYLSFYLYIYLSNFLFT